ncbi:hypothetical protein N7499_006163 [Penicillium canescens]|uniref:Uncharacterized protein n=1 Tax=Penicillium canescens TaxID=5083 RepID=A0AAD6ID48_PENCN|nr:uncharacterized protein N7446_001940 [Penicillium canescens]KAJ5997441.1 hypothetical protein N7522_009101 [Penicillium canescens]KAJ6043744.1 hypothetical protein N7460_005099 [Penicillium canescens]KAJ6055216.1 hypothetical protein N7444_004314 [Penicillium canescens]KAJ6074163.1 hypothetical protein N7446_001940 [Penicillium canescens]KAJ6081289.1 hypothetical protein N7499_006163 [Penicillium canescens]
MEEELARTEESAEEEQPDDTTRHRMALLALRPGKTWTLEDLSNEGYLRVALRLLYNGVHGVKFLHIGKSIHLKYGRLPNKEVLAKIGVVASKEIRRVKEVLQALEI